MQELINTNIYDVDYNIAIIGSCLKRIHTIFFDN